MKRGKILGLLLSFLYSVFAEQSTKSEKNVLKINETILTKGFCHSLCHSPSFFNCECGKEEWRNLAPVCIPVQENCDGWADCPDASDERECQCSRDEMQLSACAEGCTGNVEDDLYQCAPTEMLEGRKNRKDFKKKLKCLAFYSLETERCDPQTPMNPNRTCDGVVDYPLHNPNDEAECKSRPNSTNSCECNQDGKNCHYSKNGEKCGEVVDSFDSLDEARCDCSEKGFACRCNKPHVFNTVRSGSGQIELRRLSDVSECMNTPGCEPSTCYTTPSLDCAAQDCNTSDVICSSTCTESGSFNHCAFQCKDGTLILASQFCNGVIDCPDNSDEIRQQVGFKCPGLQSRDACVLPPLNLEDDVAHCADEKDLCKEESCLFECLDKRLTIASNQLCDGTVDCFDFSDECLCETNMHKENCDVIFTMDTNRGETVCTYNKLSEKLNEKLMENNPLMLQLISPEKYHTKIKRFLYPAANDEMFCQTKQGRTMPGLCNGIPECRDYRDECNDRCKNRPWFCNDPCFSHFPIGDRICDGVEDEAWKYINDSKCPKGFDEKNCPDRFYCKVGTKISIDKSQVCDGVVNCDDGSDEQQWECAQLFSDDKEMIYNPWIRALFWIMGLVVIIGNFLVILSSLKVLRRPKLKRSLQCQHLIVLNISIADFIMGIYLLTIASLSVVLSGNYGDIDHQWRSSLSCSLIGSLAIISSELSCFLMVLLAAFRLYTICRPIASLANSATSWKIGIILVWILAIILGALPIIPQASNYFAHSISFRTKGLNPDDTWMKKSLTKLACRYAALSNQTIQGDGTNWALTEKYLKEKFAHNFPMKEFGYYSETSICMPRFYVPAGEKSWEFTLVFMTINLLSFITIAACYVIMYVESRKRKKLFNQRSSKRERKMQTRIARIIATDFFCWVPICIMVYLRMSGVEFSTLACQISAALILPINSALNPFLYSSLPEKLAEKCFRKKDQKKSCFLEQQSHKKLTFAIFLKRGDTTCM